MELIDENLSISKPEENCFEVYFPSTTSLQFCVNKKMLSFVVAPAEIYKNATKGLLGTWNDDPSDEFTLPNGTVLRSSSSLRDIHFGFGVECKLTINNYLIRLSIIGRELFISYKRGIQILNLKSEFKTSQAYNIFPFIFT